MLPVIAIVAILLTGCTTAHAARIYNHDGGYVMAEREKILKARDEDRKVQIGGRCYSACTLWLSYENLCVWPGTSFGFHSPYDALTGRAVPEMADYMYRAYPWWVKDFVDRTGAMDHDKITVMPYSYTKRFVREC